MGDIIGVVAAIVSSSIGGLSVGITRFLGRSLDPLMIGVFRFGIGGLLLPPLLVRRWKHVPTGPDSLRIAGLGILYFAFFPLLFNGSLQYTTAARGALALSALPLVTMLVAASLRVEPQTLRKTVGVVVAVSGVGAALWADLNAAPPEAWKGDLLMTGAAACMAFYSVWSAPLARRYSTALFTTLAMLCGVAVLGSLAFVRGGFAVVATLGAAEWSSVTFLGVFGGAVTFLLWSYALTRTTPTLVALSATINPIVAGLFGLAALGEPITRELVPGLALVASGIVIAARDTRRGATDHAPSLKSSTDNSRNSI